MRPHVLHNRGLEAFLQVVKEPFADNIEGKRIAAKGLVNLTSNKSEELFEFLGE